MTAVSLFSLVISPEPIAEIVCPHSLLPHPPEKGLHYIGEKSRYSLCTGIAWFPDDRGFISANWLQASVQTYAFDPKTKEITPLRFFDSSSAIDVHQPENIYFSKDGKFLLIPQYGYVNLYRIGPEANTIRENPIVRVRSKQDPQIHGARISPDGRFLAFVTIGNPGQICIYRLTQEYHPTLTYLLPNSLSPLKPKGIDFSPDGKWVAIGYSGNAKFVPSKVFGALAIYRFDKEQGVIDPSPACWLESDLLNPEDVCFYPDGSVIFVSNQSQNTITVHAFEAGMIKENWVALQNPEAQLNFPHGIGLSNNGRFLGVSNYGDDKITLYSIEPP